MKGVILKIIDLYRQCNEPRSLSHLTMELGSDNSDRFYVESKIEQILFSNGDLFYTNGDGCWRVTEKALQLQQTPEEPEEEQDGLMFGAFDDED